MIYKMPGQYGSIKRVNAVRDEDSFKRNLNIYVVSEGSNGKLVRTNDVIKENLKVWINKNKMINDTIDVLDAKILNLGIDFTIVGDLETNRFETFITNYSHLCLFQVEIQNSVFLMFLR